MELKNLTVDELVRIVMSSENSTELERVLVGKLIKAQEIFQNILDTSEQGIEL